MSNKRYLEFDSTYRNRNEYPLPSVFTVLLSQSGTRNAATAYDPICAAAPIITWVPNDLDLSGGEIDLSTVNPLNTTSVFTVKFPTGTANTNSGYYIGAPIQAVVPGNTETVKIKSWRIVNLNAAGFDYFLVTVSPSFSQIPEGIVTFLSPTTNLTVGTFLIPHGFDADNYYVGSLMYNQTDNQYRKIISYDASQRLAVIDLSTGPLTGWSTSDTYTIRKAPPVFTGKIPTSVLPSNFNPITSFCVPLNTIVSVGDFVRFTSGNNENLSYRVINIINFIQTPPLPPTPLLIVTVDCRLNIVNPGVTFEVLQFTRDNVVPFCYSGSLVSQQEMVCYEIKLINLVLPNKLLVSGGRIAFYPHVYVELQNVSAASAGTKCVIYSNNPNSHKMLFRAAIDDIRDPNQTPVIKIDGDGMVQTVKFKPNDSLKFGVYLPDGRPLETVDKDYLSPLPPDPLIQISATFEIRRL